MMDERICIVVATQLHAAAAGSDSTFCGWRFTAKRDEPLKRRPRAVTRNGRAEEVTCLRCLERMRRLGYLRGEGA